MPIRLIIVLLLCLIPACARIPTPTNHPFSQQKKMQAVEHWEVLARDVASRLNHELVIYDYLTTPVYIKETCGDEANPCKQNQTSSFNEAFRDLLITQMVDYGIQTRSQPADDSLVINYKVQTVYHRAKRVRSLFPGTFTALTAAVLVLHDAPEEMIALATAGVMDLVNSAYTKGGHYEVIITTSIINANKYVFRTSDIYYINDEDFWQYQANPPQATVVSLTAPGVERASSPIVPNNSAAQIPVQTPTAQLHVPVTPAPHQQPEEQTVIEPPPITAKPQTTQKSDTDI